MTTINIYENKDNGDLILQKDYSKDLEEIKELIKELQLENLNLKKLILQLSLKYSKDNKKKNDVVDKVKDALNEANEDNKAKSVSLKESDDTVKDNGLQDKFTKEVVAEYQKAILEKIPTYTVTDAKHNRNIIQKKYPTLKNTEQRKDLLKDSYTFPNMMEDFGLSRWELKRYVIKDLVESGKIKSFRANPNKPKSVEIFYQVGKKTTGKIASLTLKVKKRKVNDNHKFVINDSNKYTYQNLKLLPNGDIEHSTDIRKYKLKYNIYDVLYIKSVSDSDSFNYDDFKTIVSKNEKWDISSLMKLIYNIRENKDMRSIINRAREVFTTDMDFDKVNDVLRINGTVTFIPTHQARSWCDTYINNGKDKDVFIWELQRRFPNINKDYIAIILYNISNDELNSVLKKNKKDIHFVENNPSKRRNLILNGGMI